jgi:hypothetical protein
MNGARKNSFYNYTVLTYQEHREQLPKVPNDKVIGKSSEKKLSISIINSQIKILTNRPTSPLTILTLIIANLKAFVLTIFANIFS